MEEVTLPRCQRWLPRKGRCCAAVALPNVAYCGNHKPSNVETRVPCPVDPSHSILQTELAAHSRKCPGLVRLEQMERMPHYRKGANAGSDDDKEEDGSGMREQDKKLQGEWSSKLKRSMFNSLSKEEVRELVLKIESAYNLHCKDEFDLAFQHPSACNKWVHADVDRRIPFQVKHVVQQASMLGNMESFGLLRSPNAYAAGKEKAPSHSNAEPVFVEFGAGRGYLAHMLADCYEAQNIVLVERRSYKFKADRTLRQNAAVSFERVRIDIENLDLAGVKSLQGCHYVALSKHLCGCATDLTLRCCSLDLLKSQNTAPVLDGIAIATCCHHLCQWKPYVNKEFFKKMGFTKSDFYILTWLTSGALSGEKNHFSDKDASTDGPERTLSSLCQKTKPEAPHEKERVDGIIGDISDWLAAADRAALGLKCKQLLDVGRLCWLRQNGMDAKFVSYVPPKITPENKLLLARRVAG